MTDKIKEQLDLAVAVKEMFASHLEEDIDNAWDKIEEFTEIPQIIDWLLEKEQDAQDAIDSLSNRIENMQARKKRYSNRKDFCRSTLLWLMTQLDEPKIIRDHATIFSRALPPKPIVSDETLIPQEYLKVSYSVNMQAIRDAIASGEKIPGVSLSNGGESLTIKRK